MTMPPVPQQGRAQQNVAPLYVEVWFQTGRLEEVYDVNVGPFGKIYPLTFIGLLNLIRMRNGHQQKRLEYKP
jgi:hypothetical protein